MATLCGLGIWMDWLDPLNVLALTKMSAEKKYLIKHWKQFRYNYKNTNISHIEKSL